MSSQPSPPLSARVSITRSFTNMLTLLYRFLFFVPNLKVVIGSIMLRESLGGGGVKLIAHPLILCTIK